MEKSEDTLSMETVSDFVVQMMNDEKDGEEFTREYLKSKFLSSSVRALYYARRKAGLTQAQVAERLNTKQAAIARLEADTDGSMSLRRYIEFAMACGVGAFSIKLDPLDFLRDYIQSCPEAPPTQEAYDAWREDRESTPVSQPVLTSLNRQTPVALVSPSDESTPAQEATLAAQSAEQGLGDVHEQDQKRTDYILLQEPKGSSQTAA